MYGISYLLTLALTLTATHGQTQSKDVTIPALNNYCQGLQNGSFVDECAKKIGDAFVSFLRSQCVAMGDDLVRIRLLLDTVEETCKQLNVSIQIQIPKCDTSAPDNASTKIASENSTTIIAPPDNLQTCGCVDLVFMVDSSNSVGFTLFKKFRDFLTLIIQELQISDSCTKVSVLSFSKTVHFNIIRSSNESEILNKVQSMPFVGLTTRTDEAVRFFNTVLKGRRATCLAVGVMLVSGSCTDWRTTLDRMTALYRDNTGPSFPVGVRVIVVALDELSSDPAQQETKERALASGLYKENLVKLTDSSQLNGNYSQIVVDMIKWDGASVDLGCSQWVVLDTVQTKLGDSYVGVYEKTTLCNGRQVFIHTSGKWWLSSLEITALGSEMYWSIFGHNPAETNCVDPKFMVAILNERDLKKPSEGTKTWLEYGVSEGNSKIQVKCFN